MPPALDWAVIGDVICVKDDANRPMHVQSCGDRSSATRKCTNHTPLRTSSAESSGHAVERPLSAVAFCTRVSESITRTCKTATVHCIYSAAMNPLPQSLALNYGISDAFALQGHAPRLPSRSGASTGSVCSGQLASKVLTSRSEHRVVPSAAASTSTQHDLQLDTASHPVQPLGPVGNHR